MFNIPILFFNIIATEILHQDNGQNKYANRNFQDLMHDIN